MCCCLLHSFGCIWFAHNVTQCCVSCDSNISMHLSLCLQTCSWKASTKGGIMLVHLILEKCPQPVIKVVHARQNPKLRVCLSMCAGPSWVGPALWKQKMTTINMLDKILWQVRRFQVQALLHVLNWIASHTAVHANCGTANPLLEILVAWLPLRSVTALLSIRSYSVIAVISVLTCVMGKSLSESECVTLYNLVTTGPQMALLIRLSIASCVDMGTWACF